MIHHVVIAGDPAAVEKARPRLAVALENTAYFEGGRREAMAADGSWALAAIECPDPLAPGRIVVRDDTFLVLNGPALAVGAPQEQVVEHLLAAFVRDGPAAAQASATGAFNLVGGAPEFGVGAAVDFAGMMPVYWAAGDGITVISNRSSTAQHVAGRHGLDASALAWLASLNLIIGSSMPQMGVSRLTPGYHLRVRADGASVMLPLTTTASPAPGDEPRHQLSPQEWDAVTDHLVSGARSLRGGPELALLLSGGFDSRLCLAIAKAAGLNDSIITVTRGTSDHPEMTSAVEAARAAGFRHTDRPPISLAPGPSDGDDGQEVGGLFSSPLWQRIRQSAYRYDTTVCPWDGLTPLSPMKGTIVEIKGFLGGLFKGTKGADNRYAKGVPADPDELATALFNFMQPNDPLDVVAHHHLEAQRSWLKIWVESALTRTRLDNLPIRFYLEHRTGNWTGPMQQFAPGRVTVNLLGSPTAARAAGTLTAEAANSRRFHYEVMRRTAPELVQVPFFNDRWPDQIVAEGAFDLSRDPFPAPEVTLTRAIRSWQWEFLSTEADAIHQLLAEATGTVLSEVYRMDELLAAARRAPELKRAADAKAMLSAIAIALAATGRADRVCDEPLADF